MDSAILSPVSPVDNFCPRLIWGTKFLNHDNNLGHLFTACPRCPRQKMSIPKEKQFLPERVPRCFWWQKMQPLGLLPCRLSPLGRAVLRVAGVAVLVASPWLDWCCCPCQPDARPGAGVAGLLGPWCRLPPDGRGIPRRRFSLEGCHAGNSGPSVALVARFFNWLTRWLTESLHDLLALGWAMPPSPPALGSSWRVCVRVIRAALSDC